MNNERNVRALWLAGIALAVGLVIAAFFWGRSAYRHLKERRDAARAQAFLAKGDYRSALLSARLVLLINSNNVPACRIMGQLADVAHSPLALDWYQRLVQLSPTLTNQLLLAAAALRYQGPPYPLTTQVLGDLSNSAAQVPDYHILSAELALARHDMAGAQAQFEIAGRLDPTNRLLQLNLAVIRLASTNAAVAAAARAALQQFSHDPALAPPALRSLIADRLLHDDAATALTYSTELLAGPQATLADRLQQLGILKRLRSPKLAGELKQLQVQSRTNAVMTAQVASWMTGNGLLTQTTNWLGQLPGEIRSQGPVRLALVDCFLAGQDWPALRDFTAKGPWKGMDYLRLAFLSHAWNELGNLLVADGYWSSAVSAAGRQLSALAALEELAGRWGLNREQEDVLRRILRNFPDAGWAQHDLEELYFTAGNTRALYQLYTDRLAIFPRNLELENNQIFTALLLKTNLTRACRQAGEIYVQSRNDPNVASTYAYALHLQHRDREGLAVLQKLDRTQLEQPSVALYYGLLLAASGKTNEAGPYLEIARTRGHLLPEEKQLLTQIGK